MHSARLNTDQSPERATHGTPRLILGTVVSNGGDAAILHAQLTLLQRALGDASTLIEDGDPALAAEIFPSVEVIQPGRIADTAMRASTALRNVRIPGVRVATGRLAQRELPALAQRAADAQLDRALSRRPYVFYTGGTSLIEKYDMTAKLRHIRRAMALGREVILLPQSVGPFHDAGNVAAINEIVASATLVLLRDERSLGHLAQIGADLLRVRVVPDVVFCLAGQEDVDRLQQATIPAGNPKVALGVRDCRKFFRGGDADDMQDRLEERYAELATHLVRTRGAEVTFVSTCQGIDRYWTDDSEVSVLVYERLAADVQEHCTVDRGFHDTQDLRRVLANQDLIVMNRLHGAILALTVGVPVVPVEYEFKTREVFRQLGQEVAVYSIEDATSRSLADHVDGFIQAWNSRRSAASSSLGNVVDEAWQTADVIRSALSPPRS